MAEIKNLSLSFGDKVVLENFSLTLSGGITALSGPSGCGKTTLLRILAGLQKPDSGTVEGIDPSDCVILFQENRLLPRRSVRRQITAVLPRGRWGEAEDWLRFVELDGEGDSRIDQLSGGMQRRLALARALAASSRSSQPTKFASKSRWAAASLLLSPTKPLRWVSPGAPDTPGKDGRQVAAPTEGTGWLLLDEPFAGVDAERARRILRRIRALGVDVLLASHEEHVLAECDAVVEMKCAEK